MKMIYHVDDEQFTNAADAAEYIAERLPEESYDEMLDECYGTLEIMGVEFEASRVLYTMDNVAYRCGYSDWQDSEYSDIKYTLKHMIDGDEEDFWGFTVRAEDIEADDISASA